jgi:hypothetical protein
MQPGCCDTRNWNSIQLRMYRSRIAPMVPCAPSQKCLVIETIEDALKDPANDVLG